MRTFAVFCLATLMLIGVGLAGWWGWSRHQHQLTPERCTITAPGAEPVSLSPEQASMTAIIAAASWEAGLPERAAVVALATAYQESGIRNLDYGDRDSLGLFQQRPDPRFEWGTAEQITDPWYSSLRFYEELVKFPNWETTDINDQAQKVQRSGFPEAYRKHVPNAEVLAAATHGSTQEAVTCVRWSSPSADPAPLEDVVRRVPGVEYSIDGNTVTLRADDDARLWSAVQLAMLTSYDSAVTRVQVGARQWQLGDEGWTDADEAVEGAVLQLG